MNKNQGGDTFLFVFFIKLISSTLGLEVLPPLIHILLLSQIIHPQNQTTFSLMLSLLVGLPTQDQLYFL